MSVPGFRVADGFAVHPLDTSAAESVFSVESSSGRRWQVNRATVELLEALHGSASMEEAAERVAHAWGRPVDGPGLADYVRRVMVPSGMVTVPGQGEAASERRASGSLGFLSYRRVIVPARWLDVVSGRLAFLFHPAWFWPVGLAMLAVFVGLLATAPIRAPGALGDALAPGALLLALASTFVHELGHAAACRRFGTRHGSLGFGVYLVFPVLYMELDETWRLTRRERAVVDAGGLYLQLAYALGLAAVGAAVPEFGPVAAGASTLIGIMLVVNLNPLFRFDGYWLLSDLLGIPNLRQRSLDVLGARWRALRGGPAPRAELVPGGLPPGMATALLLYGAASLLFFAWFLGRLLLAAPRYALEEYPRLAAGQWASLQEAVASVDVLKAVWAFVSLVPPTALLVGLPLLLVIRGRRVMRALLGARGAVREPETPTPLR